MLVAVNEVVPQVDEIEVAALWVPLANQMALASPLLV
jgi:hypothetical protein